MINKKVTLIALSWEKKPYLKRLILSYTDYDYHLILADGSSEPWNWPNTGSSGRLTWEYFNLDGRANPVGSYVHRFVEAISKVNTEYVTFIDDEEILFPIGIEKSIQKLDLDINASCAGGGIATLFSLGKNEMKVGRWGRRSDPYQLTSQNFDDRINLIINDERTANLTYQVMRTSIVKDFSSILKESDFKYFASPEVFITLHLLKNGTWEMGRYPYWLRVTGPAHESLDRWDSGNDFMSPSEAYWIASSIYPDESVKKENLYSLILCKWGTSRVNSIEQENTFLSFRKLKNRAKEFLRKIPFLLYFYKRLSNKQINTPTLMSYFQEYSEWSLESFHECIFFESILQKFPTGISGSSDTSLKF